jgi:hypothetical protein
MFLSYLNIMLSYTKSFQTGLYFKDIVNYVYINIKMC